MVEKLTTQDIAGIREVTAAFPTLLVAQDFDALAKLYTEDTVFMPPNQPAVNGRAALRAWMDEFPKVTQCRLDIDEVDGCDEFAYVRGTYGMTLEIEGAGTVEDVGKYIEIRRKQADGSWLMSADIFNSDNG